VFTGEIADISDGANMDGNKTIEIEIPKNFSEPHES